MKAGSTIFDVIVVGAGHAGCEAALASARMGCRTLLLTLNMDFIALPPCNPSIGGTAKGQVVREIDALGGEMARNIDETFIQIRMLNDSKGPAVQALRAQMDRTAYMKRMKSVLEAQENLELRQALVTEILTQEPQIHRDKDTKKKANNAVRQCVSASVRRSEQAVICGVRTQLGQEYFAKAVVLTTGTSLDSRIIIGDTIYSGGRNGEMPAIDLSKSLKKHGCKIVRWKTGTPPRIDATSVDWGKLTVQPGSTKPLWFSHYYDSASVLQCYSASVSKVERAEGTIWWDKLEKLYPQALTGWLPQVPCYLAWTNKKTQKIVRDNFDRAPLFSGVITGVGPRYCPSFEGKVANFSDKEKHQFFLEPEGWDTTEIYLQGANTSLPEDVQWSFVRSIRGLENAAIVRPGYAIEYDGVSTTQLMATLESKVVSNLFLAGQINGTSGYEEAAGQGLLAGINATRTVQHKEHIWFRRSDAYIGVMIDDLINKDITEPYRLMTARAEYRLLLRSDNADLRLSELGHEVGLLSDEQYAGFVNYRHQLSDVRHQLESKKFKQSRGLNIKLGKIDQTLKIHEAVSYADFLKRPKASVDLLLQLDSTLVEQNPPQSPFEKGGNSSPPHNSPLDNGGKARGGIARLALDELAIQLKYEGYIRKQQDMVEKFNRLEDKKIPKDFDYDLVKGLRNEAREQLKRFHPLSIGQAARISGVNPADVAVLIVWLEKKSY